MGRLEIVSLRELLDLLRRQRRKEFLRELAQKRVPQTVDAFEMFEEQNEPFKMRGLEFAVDAVERMRDRMRDFSALQIPLQRKNIISNDNDIVVLLFGNTPDQDVNLAGVLREISGDLLADKRVRQIADLETAVDRVVVRDGDEIHPAFHQLSMELARVGIGIRKIKSAEKPLFRARAEAGVNVKVTFAHIYLEAALETLLGDPVLVGRWRPSAVHFTDKIDNLPPNGRMRKIRQMNTEP